MYLCDSNVYIHGFNSPAFGEELQEFHSKHLPQIALSVVVAHELLIGTTTAAKERSLRRGLIDPFPYSKSAHMGIGCKRGSTPATP